MSKVGIFYLTEDQEMFKVAIERFLADCHSFQGKPVAQEVPRASQASIWSKLAEMGVLGLSIPEAYGGLGGGALDLRYVMELLGQALVREPFLTTVVLGAYAVEIAGNDEQKSRILPAVAKGKMLVSFAHEERATRYNPEALTTTATKIDGGWMLEGEKFMVLGGDTAGIFIVSARLIDSGEGRGSIGLFLLSKGAEGLTNISYTMQDGMGAANLTLRSVVVSDADTLCVTGEAIMVVERVNDRAIAATAAEAVGIMQDMLDMTVNYLKTRKQFGVTIGTFQALQHRAVDMLVALDQARSMAFLAAGAVTIDDATERKKAISATKVQINNSARLVSQQAIQLHGGIGLTMEYKIAHSFLRLSTLQYLFGDAEHHISELARSGGFISDQG